MTREQFNTLSFEEVMQQLESERDDITTIDLLKDFIKNQIDEDNYYLALHVLEAIANDPIDYEYYDYDYSMGTLDKPSGISCKEDIEHMIDD